MRNKFPPPVILRDRTRGRDIWCGMNRRASRSGTLQGADQRLPRRRAKMRKGGGVPCPHRESWHCVRVGFGTLECAAPGAPAMPNVSVHGGGSLAAEQRLCAGQASTPFRMTALLSPACDDAARGRRPNRHAASPRRNKAGATATPSPRSRNRRATQRKPRSRCPA